MKTITISKPLVTTDWLANNLKADNLVVLDGTINKVFNDSTLQIPKARLFDIKKKFSNTANPFPSAFPSIALFQESARELGINNNSAIVVYDDKGIYSSARVWWLFKAFGYKNVAVLNGGFPAWLNAKLPTEPMETYTGEIGDFTPKLQPELMRFFNDVQTASQAKTHIIVDARSSGRFNCETPEPREGLRMGTIPNSVNLPFTNLLNNGIFKSQVEIEHLFKNVAEKDDDIIFSCGSGITACVLALGAELSGYKNISVYDGSWTEWGSLVTE
ncbi:sulfurtransferase [Postechiella marina]|uniref:Sulfurtransferase n=1 Tax=Postechiella marina TaxID=943941 RepID=A0ABP8CBZ9_9FLAO